jgi:hypothetical protein
MNYPKNKTISNYHKILLILMVLSTLILGSIILINSKANFTISPSGFTPTVGGPGGSETGLQSCPLGTIAIGMEGKAVTQTDAVREGFGYLSDYATRCGTYTIDPITKEISTNYDSTTASVSGFIVASRTPIPKALDCPNGSVLGGYTGFQKFNASHNTTLVIALKPRCSALTIDLATNLIVIAEKTDYGPDYVVDAPPAGSDPIAKADCDSNSVVTGFEGRVGELFDLFKLACGTINQASLIVSIAGLNYTDYKVIATDGVTSEKYDLTHKNAAIIPPSDNYTLILENTKTGETYQNFVCDKALVQVLAPYTIKVDNNQSIFCTIEPINSVTNPTTPIQNPGQAPTPTADKITTTALNNTITPTVLTKTTATTRTGGIYLSVITVLILGIVGILIFFKLKRKN